MNVFNRRYFIVDNMGRYYVVDENDTLTLAKEDSRIESFNIIEANKRIGNSSMKSMLKTLTANESAGGKDTKQSQKTVKAYDMDKIDLVELTEKISFIYQNINSYQKRLQGELGAVDEELCDLAHFIELYDSDEKALELVHQIYGCRKRRRSIKDQLYKAETFSKLFKHDGIEIVLKEIRNHMKKLKTREYMPRVLAGMFVGAAKRKEELSPPGQDKKEQEVKPEEEYMEEQMNYERQDTIYDEAKTNWDAMVMQQKEFFENAQQYIINLQLDLEELDKRIENFMERCESTKCNVTQGYKLLMQLKDMRCKRAEKIKELNKVSTIVECFDCNAMVDIYRYCSDTFSMWTEKENITMGTPEIAENGEESHVLLDHTLGEIVHQHTDALSMLS